MMGTLCRECIICNKRFPIHKRRKVCRDCQIEAIRNCRRKNKMPQKIH